MQFSDYQQKDSMLCGITCLQMICKYYGAYLKLNYLQELCQEGREGISLAAIKQGTESLGFECLCGFANTTSNPQLSPSTSLLRLGWFYKLPPHIVIKCL